MKKLSKEPLNMIIAGVGGQGNVLLSFLIGKALVQHGYFVSVGDTYGASQRGGSVASHVRISEHTCYGSLIPSGHADVILSLEPAETLRMLCRFGNPDVVTITNTRPIYPSDVTSGNAIYPKIDELLKLIEKLSAKVIVIKATDEAFKLGNPIFSNVILIGALIGSGALPLDKQSLEPILKENFPKEFDANMEAFNTGMKLAGH
jgi:indolepyruvate ferredoxin oxidoreductase beta subunit